MGGRNGEQRPAAAAVATHPVGTCCNAACSFYIPVCNVRVAGTASSQQRECAAVQAGDGRCQSWLLKRPLRELPVGQGG